MKEETIERENNNESNNNFRKKIDKGIKRKENQRKNKNNGSTSPKETPKTVYVPGDSMVKKLNDYKQGEALSRYLVKVLKSVL